MDKTHAFENLEADLLEVVEAVLFVSDEPVKPGVIAAVYGEVTGQAAPALELLDAAVDRLNEDYRTSGRIFRIKRWAGGFQFATEPRVDPFLRTLYSEHRARKLSASLLETLAIVAYRQPVSKPEIDAVRGVDAGYAIRRLLELGFLEILGRSEAIGRPLIYGTTERFLAQFGLNSLEDLPELKDLDELLADPEVLRESQKYLGPEADPAAFARGNEHTENHEPTEPEQA